MTKYNNRGVVLMSTLETETTTMTGTVVDVIREASEDMHGRRWVRVKVDGTSFEVPAVDRRSGNPKGFRFGETIPAFVVVS